MPSIKLTPKDIILLEDSKKVNEVDWNIFRWKVENPIDYFKYVKILNGIPKDFVDIVFMEIYKISRLYIPDNLFKFYSLDDSKELNKVKMDTLSRKEVYLSNLSYSNDPFDGKAAYFDFNIIKEKKIDMNFCDILHSIQNYQMGASLTELCEQDMQMWSKYSNEHKGYCIKYRKENNPSINSFAFPIQYIKNKIDISEYLIEFYKKFQNEYLGKEDFDIKKFVEKNIIFIYLVLMFNNLKNSSWSNEKEFRISVTDEKPVYLSLIPDEMYIGKNCSDENTRELLKIGIKENIKVYKMTEPKIDDFELQKVELFLK